MTNNPQDTLRNEDLPQNTLATLRRLLHRLGRQKRKLAVILISTLFSCAAYALLPLAVGRGIDALAQLIQTGVPAGEFWTAAVSALKIPVLMIAAAALTSSLFSYLQQFLIASVGEQLTLSFRQDISAKLNRLPLRYYDAHKTGEIMSRVTNDLEKVSAIMQEGLPQLIASLFTILFAVLVMIKLNLLLFGVVLVSLAVSMAATGYVSKLAQRAYGENLASMGALTGKLEELYAGNRVVKIFNLQAVLTAETEVQIERQFRAQRNAQFADFVIYPAIRALGQLGFIATAVIGGGLAFNGVITLGTVQAFVQYVNQIAEPVTETAYVITSLQAAIAGAERVFALLDEPEEIPDAGKGAEAITAGHVQFKHVRFGYRPGSTLIHDLNLEVRPNQQVAIVGPTGGGKTTLINLLMRFYDVTGGQIKVENIDIREVTRKSLRAGYGMVLQDTWLKTGTIRENITMGRPDATEEEIIGAAKASHIHSYISRLPKGYDTWITEDGGGLSQGQKQLLCIARVMLCRPPMLILDEATSSIDTRTELKSQQAFAKLMEGRTTFIVAHRLSTIREADVILVMKDGKVIEQGNHESLLEQGGFYRHLYESQFAH